MQVRENINQVFSRFIDSGRVTISFKEPQHDICVSKAEPRDLKKLVHAIKLGFNGEDIPNVGVSTPGIRKDAMENLKLELKVKSRKDYPLLKPFPPSLTKLYINSCGLVSFDLRILKLQHISVLNLNENNLQQLPESLESLVNLKELFLAKNNLNCVPECIFKPVTRSCLRLLDLSSNRLENVSPRIGLLKKLANLRLDNNGIIYLPYSIGMLTSLRYLSVAKNSLRLLPYGFCMLNIDSLDLSGNPLDMKAANCIVLNKLVNVPTLYEIAGRSVKDHSLLHTNEQLPSTIRGYLENSRICICGKSCFESHAVYITMLDLGKIAHTISADILDDGKMSAPAEGYLCSLKCYMKWQRKPNAIWK